ncbi:MAG: pyrroloquinoline quinone biosynthesis protein B, partial [Candidatus Thiodiazotropha sp.]
IEAGISNKLGSEMGHLDQSGKGGIIDIMSGLVKPRKILIHINNTNPILVDDSPERQALSEAGIEVSHDGMQVEL